MMKFFIRNTTDDSSDLELKICGHPNQIKTLLKALSQSAKIIHFESKGLTARKIHTSKDELSRMLNSLEASFEKLENDIPSESILNSETIVDKPEVKKHQHRKRSAVGLEVDKLLKTHNEMFNPKS